MLSDLPLKAKRTAIFDELAVETQDIIHALQVIAVFMGLVVFPISAISGPAILSTAQPAFQDPLSGARAPVIEQRGDAVSGLQNSEQPPSDSVGANDAGFTIIGDTGTSGLEEPENNDLTQAVRDELLGRARVPDTSESRLSADETAGETTGSAASIVRVLLNSVPGQNAGVGVGVGVSAGARAGGGAGNTGPRADGSLIASVIDSTVTDLVIALLNPEQAADGMVTFSMAGFGEFALLRLQENNSFFIVDMRGGTAIKFAQGEQNIISPERIQRSTGTELPPTLGAKSNGLQRVLLFLETNVLPFVQSPITLAALGLFSIIWIIWRLSAQG